MISIGFSFDPSSSEPTPAEPASAADVVMQDEVNAAWIARRRGGRVMRVFVGGRPELWVMRWCRFWSGVTLWWG
jgi:hypothetical protein